MNTDQLIARFDDLIDRYKDTQLHGNAGARAAARKELMGAFKAAVLAAPAPSTSAQQVEPVAWIVDVPGEPELGHWFAEEPAGEGYRSRALGFVSADPAPSASPAETMTLQEVWEAAGGNPGIKATRADVLTALRDLDAVCEAADKGASPADQGDPWIPINEREPAPETDVLLKGHRPGFAEEKYDIGGLFHDKWMSEITQDDCKIEVTHWMEIPQ